MPDAAKGPIRIIVVDDHPAARTGLCHLLQAQADFAVIGEAAGGAAALAIARALRWDVLILDLGLPDMPGLEALRGLKQQFPTQPVMVVSGHSETRFGLAALTAGASGYLTKAGEPNELCRAIRAVARGGRYMGADLEASFNARSATARCESPHAALSPRELEVLRALAGGAAAVDVAASLKLSAKTIATYRMRILQKMNLRSNADIIYYAMQHGLIGPEPPAAIPPAPATLLT